MTASPLQWCCCEGSKFTRVTTDAIGIVYSCLVSNVTYISIGLVLSCTLFLIDTFISKVLVLSCTVYLINTVSYLSGAVMHVIPSMHRENCNNKQTFYSY